MNQVLDSLNDIPAEGKPSAYVCPVLRPITNPIRFAAADTDLDGTPAPYTCPACKNPDFECVCGVQA